MENLIIYTLIICITIYAFILNRKYTGANAVSLNKGYRADENDIAILLSRIKWVNRYKNRVNYVLRYIIYSSIISSLLCIVVGDVPAGTFLQMFLITWLSIYSLHKYFDHHAEKYAHYYIYDNVKMLQKLLRLKDIDDFPTHINNEPITSECHNFI